MQLSGEEEKFMKITKLVLDIFPKYLRECFIKQWNKKFPSQTWQSDNASGSLFINSLPHGVKTDRSRKKENEKLAKGNEEEWDTTTIVYALLETGLKLVEGSRPKGQRNDPLRISEQIELIRDVRNFVAHASCMSCSSTKFTELLTEIKSKATDIFDTTAVQKIEEIENSRIESQLAVELKKKLEVEKQRNKAFDELFNFLEEFKEETNEKFCEVDEKFEKYAEKVDKVQSDVEVLKGIHTRPTSDSSMDEAQKERELEVKEEVKETRKKVEQVGEKIEKKLEQILQQFKDKSTTKSDLTPFASPTNDAHVTHSPFIRSEKKLISKHGAIMELYITGITLEVPEGALECDAVVQLATLYPYAIPKLSTDVGEEVLSNIIYVGPEEVRFNVPAILSIPHSLTETPKHSSICIQLFDFDTNKWERLSLSSDLDKLDANHGYITKPGVYALCLCLDAEIHFIPRTSTLIRPFNEENGVAITFADNTFDNDETKVEIKLNTLTERMYEGFKSAGIKSSVILHINAANNDQPKMPVSIAMPIPKDVNLDENIRIFQCDHGDDFTDVTEKITFKIKEHCVILRVDHFTNFWSYWTSIEVPDFAPLLKLFYPLYKVYFSCYMRAETIRVGCCEWSLKEVMDNHMSTRRYTIAEFITRRLHNGDTSTIALHGRYKISENASGVQLMFNTKEIEYTDPLYLEASESTNEMSSRLKNEVTISIHMEGARDPVFLKLVKEDDSAIQSPHQPSVTKIEDEKTKEANTRILGQDTRSESVECDSCDTAKEPLLSELMNDYNFVEKLENTLEGASVSNIKALLLATEYSYEQRCKILNPSTANLAFFDHLAKCRPDLTLRDLRNDVEKAMEVGNTSIFSKIDEDISNGSVTFKLESTLGELSAVPRDWQYILERVAGELIPEEGSMLPSWQDIASVNGYSAPQIDYIKRHNKDHDKGPLQKVLSLLCEREHVPTVSWFVDKLKQIKRADVAKMVEEWQLK